MIAVLVATAVASGLVSGIFFAFSTFAMKALRALPAQQGMAAMQQININAVEPPLMLAMFGTAVGAVVSGGWAILNLSEPGAGWALAGAVVYLVGVIVVTAAFHVPRNNALAEVSVDAEEAEAAWRSYASSWTAGNHVRVVAPLLAALAFTLAALS